MLIFSGNTAWPPCGCTNVHWNACWKTDFITGVYEITKIWKTRYYLMKKLCGYKGLVSPVFKMCYVMSKEKLPGDHRATWIYFIVSVCCLDTPPLNCKVFWYVFFSPCRILLPLSFSSPCAILFPAANKQAAEQGWCHPISAGKTSKNLNPSISNIVYSPSVFPNFKSTYASSLGIRGRSQGSVSVSFNRPVAWLS